MGTCEYCGSRFPLTRSTRKYCTPRCKTNACLDRHPSRIRAAEVRELFAMLEEDFRSVDEVRERLRQIVAPERPPIVEVPVTQPEPDEAVYIPGMD